MKLKTTVCELSNFPSILELEWRALCAHATAAGSDLVVLPEMPFFPWVAQTNQVDPGAWKASVLVHDLWIDRLAELGVPMVVGSRPIIHQGKWLNQGFVWESENGYRPAHDKVYLPDEEGFWEASWYQPGSGEFRVIEARGVRIGFLICTEIWFTRHAREYAKQEVDLLVCPRVTPKTSVEMWVTGGRAAAVVSGAYCLSSNLSSRGIQNSVFGGTGWITEPEYGGTLGTTSQYKPFLTLELDLEIPKTAKHTYPRYVKG